MLDWEVSWFGPAGVARERQGTECVVQAMSGLMSVNGRDDGRPLPIGLPVASVAAGVLAAHGVVAGLIAQARGRPTHPVQTSVLQAGLLLCSHYIAAATSGQDPWLTPPAAAPGPPFRTADAHWVEIETLDPEAWRVFWHRLGAGGAELGKAWAKFRARYFDGACSLPLGLHEAVAARDLAELLEVAGSCRVSLCPLRGYDEVLGELGDWEAHPVVAHLDAQAGPSVSASGQPAFGPPSQSTRICTSGLPLEGFIVVEATTRMQGPLAGLLLAMLGATVIKVEPPGGDIGRMMAPLAGDEGTFFSCWNRGKQTIELDLASSDGRRDLVELVSDADAFVQNWRPGQAEQWALAPDDLARQNPRLVYVRASGWGPRPERDHLLGTDFLVQAFSGIGEGLRPHGEAPRTSRVLLTDFMGALVTCEGVLHGLYLRQCDGVGRRVLTSLLAGAATLQAHVLDGLRRGAEVGRRGGRPLWGPLDVPVQTADGFLALGPLDGDALEHLCRACGVPGGAVGAAVEGLVAERLGVGKAGEWEERLLEVGIPVAVVREDLAALPGDPALAGLFEPLGGSCWVPASPWRFSG
jgi:CoA:oxalate CoA-transferase